ncbi:hypothetical protein DFH07DRAFT_766906 [Mycena maculata]|uniref:Uncharacterized protein n=1 Tax=Mycena maculata TaxID=230809 RepID=A0AAD7K0Q3_9AGAR|nr:hypothetical protein DFH07DRAFT_766906 [Mycena maculata]
MGRNQHKPNSPLEDIAPHIHRYWKQRKAILRLLNEYHIDKTKYGLGLTRFRQIHESLGLYRTRSQHHDINSIRPALLRLRAQYPKAGAREIVSLLFHEENMSVSRNMVTEYFSVFEPEFVKERRKNRLRRKRFWAAGVNDIWAVDQHDKLKYKFGLALHTGIDPFIGFTHWLKIWWTNSNPRLVLRYYLDEVEEQGYGPLVSQSDPGTENFGLANGHTLIRHFHDPSLRGTLQHRWMREKKNVMPEISWSQLRHRFTPGFEDILDIGVNNGWYDPDILLEALVFRWVLPHGVPNDMAEHPGDYGVLDFKIKVEQEAINMVCALYAPPDHEVFQLVPPDFHAIITQMYAEIGQPAVTRESCWNIYLQLLGKFCILDNLYNIPQDMDAEWGYALTMAREEHAKDIELIPNLQPLLGYYMGGVNNGEGLSKATVPFQHNLIWTTLNLDSEQSAQLDRMLDEDEPPVAQDNEDDTSEIFAWFSDDELAGNSEIDEW